MIDWPVTGALLAVLHRRRTLVTDALNVLRKSLPKFQNVEYPVSPLPVAIRSSAADQHRITAERYMRLLERTIELYLTSSSVRNYFGLSRDANELVCADPGMHTHIRISRLDGYIAPDSSIRFLENNTDCPAGILFTERLNRLVDLAIADSLQLAGITLRTLPLDLGDCARQQLLAAYHEWGGSKQTPTVVILQIKGRENVESFEMAHEFSTLGTPTIVADPRDVAVSPESVTVSGRPVDVFWNKINTVYWNRLALETPSMLSLWADAINSRMVCHVNTFAARYVTESKLCGAFLQEPEFASAFDAADREFVTQVLPWSRKMTPDRLVDYGGQSSKLTDLVLARQADFVLKEPYDIRGDGVTIGRAVCRGIWREAVARAAREGHIAQEFITGQTYPVFVDVCEGGVVPMTTSIDSFVFGGQLIGFGSKAGRGHKVNVFQGGQKLAARIYNS